MQKVPLSKTLISFFEVEVEDGYLDDEEVPGEIRFLLSLVDFESKKLTIPKKAQEVGALRRILTNLSNEADEVSRERSVPDDYRSFMRRASDQLTTLCGKLSERELRENPFRSQAQWKQCFAAKDPNWDCHAWAHETKRSFSKLPKYRTNASDTGKLRVAAAEAYLDGVVSYEGRSMSRREFVNRLVREGRKLVEKSVPKYKFSRAKFNSLEGEAQREYERRSQEKKLVKCAVADDGSYLELSETEADFFRKVASGLRKNADSSWWKWAFGEELHEMSDQRLRKVAQTAWDTNDGEVLRAARAEAKRRGIQVV